LKEPLARITNKEDECKGTFWASRFKSIAIRDEEFLLATCAYVDLNPVAARIAGRLEQLALSARKPPPQGLEA
jgi:REP element-mobilizing transposase RayT